MPEQKRSKQQSSTEPGNSVRLFYALWPDDFVRDQLAALQTGITGRKVDPANLHLTLAFLGNQPSDSLSMLEDILLALPLTPFKLRINSFGYFSKPQIVWTGPSSAPEKLVSMQHTLWQSLLDRGVPLKAVARFRPHITLARDAACLEREWKADVEWCVGMIALVESIAIPGGVRYRLVAQRQL